MKIITFTLCTLVFVALGSRRDLQSAPWALDVEQLSGSCDEADEMWHKLWLDATNLCSETINRMTPPAICRQQNSQPCPPGVEDDCPDADPFHKVCSVNYETCARSLEEKFWNTINELISTVLGPFGEVSKLTKYALKGLSAGVTAGMMALDWNAQHNYGKAIEEAKLAFRKLFHDHPDLLMEMVEYEFSRPEQRESMSSDWSKINGHTQQTILAHACRREADKALRYVDLDMLMEDMKAKSTFYDQSLSNQADCLSLLSTNGDNWDNEAADCVSMAASLSGIFDPTPISAVLEQLTDLDWCPDFQDQNDPHYNPRATLSADHPWHLVKEKLVDHIRLSGEPTNAPNVQNSRGDGESMSHQLRRKMLSQACPTKFQFSKGVCRPVSLSEHSKFAQNLVHYHDTAPQLIFVNEGSASHDQCCDKEGMTTIRTERDCERAVQELRPWARYLGKVDDDSIPYGCYADVRTQDVGFNTNQSNKRLTGLYAPICGAGVNRYEVPEFNIIKAAEGYVMGSLGEACPQNGRIVRQKDCKFAIEKLSGNNPAFGSSVASEHKMGGCSLRADESKGWYNDKHPKETDIPDNDAPSSCQPYTVEQCRRAAEKLGLQLGGHGHDFEDNYNQKGCYAYSSGRYAGMAFYGTQFHTSFWEMINPSTYSTDTFRPQGYDCQGEPIGLKTGGSYPICYMEGVIQNEEVPRKKRTEMWSPTYYFTPHDCPPGWLPSADWRRSGFWGFQRKCFQEHWSCADYPMHLLVEGRSVENTQSPVCLDMTLLGNA